MCENSSNNNSCNYCCIKILLRRPYHNSYMGTVSHLCVASCELHDHLWLKKPYHIDYIYMAFPQCVPVNALLDDYAVKKPYHIDYIYMAFAFL